MKNHFIIITLAIILVIGANIPPVTLAQEMEAPETSPPGLDIQWITWGSNITQITTGIRLTRSDWYVEAAIGGFSAFENRENAFFLGINLGRRVFILDWLYLGTDLGYRHIMPGESDNTAILADSYFTLDARLKLEVILGEHLSAFVGAGTTNIYHSDSPESNHSNEGSIFWGVGLL